MLYRHLENLLECTANNAVYRNHQIKLLVGDIKVKILMSAEAFQSTKEN